MTQTPDNLAPDKSTSARTPLWLRIIFFLSLALNLLVAGLVIGHMLGDGPDRRVPRVDRMGGPMTFALSHEDRRAIGDDCASAAHAVLTAEMNTGHSPLVAKEVGQGRSRFDRRGDLCVVDRYGDVHHVL